MILNPWKLNSIDLGEKEYEVVFELSPTNERSSKITIRSSKGEFELKHRIDKATYEYLYETEKHEVSRQIVDSSIAEMRKLFVAIESIDFENYKGCKKRGYDGVTISITKIVERNSKQISFWNPSRESCQEVYDVLDELFILLEKTSKDEIEYEQVDNLKRHLEYKD